MGRKAVQNERLACGWRLNSSDWRPSPWRRPCAGVRQIRHRQQVMRHNTNVHPTVVRGQRHNLAPVADLSAITVMTHCLPNLTRAPCRPGDRAQHAYLDLQAGNLVQAPDVEIKAVRCKSAASGLTRDVSDDSPRPAPAAQFCWPRLFKVKRWPALSISKSPIPWP